MAREIKRDGAVRRAEGVVLIMPGVGVGAGGVYPQLPDTLAGWPITWTDSLLDTETSGTI